VLDNLNAASFFSRSGNFISFHDTLPLGRKSDLFFRQTVRGSYDVEKINNVYLKANYYISSSAHFVLLSHNLL